VRAIPWPSGRWRARRRIDTGHAGRLYGRERARGHVQQRCRGRCGVGRGKGCRLRHRSDGGPPASRGAHGRGRHSAAQRTCARRAGRPTRRTGGRVGLIEARRGACNRDARWRQQPPTRRRNRRRRAGTITRGSSWARQAPKVAARGYRAQLGAVEGAWGQAPSGPSDPCGRTVLLSHVTPFAFTVPPRICSPTDPNSSLQHDHALRGEKEKIDLAGGWQHGSSTCCYQMDVQVVVVMLKYGIDSHRQLLRRRTTAPEEAIHPAPRPEPPSPPSPVPVHMMMPFFLGMCHPSPIVSFLSTPPPPLH